VATLFALAGAVVYGTPNFTPKTATAIAISRAIINGIRAVRRGPIAGTGLPVLAVGYGVCWLIKRGRRKVE